MVHRSHHTLRILLFVLFVAMTIASVAVVRADSEHRISGPFVTENLAIYFVRGTSSPGPVPLTLQEAMAKAVVQVYETGNINEIAIENRGDEEVFVQSGDIVKGGKQDRALTVSLLLPPHSGRIPIASFCVEPARWSQRGHEDVSRFSSAAAAMPSREAKLAMKAPRSARSAEPPNSADPSHRAGSETHERQQAVWDYLASTRRRLSANAGAAPSQAPVSTSMQIALEDEKLKEAQQRYVKILQPIGDNDQEIIGFIFAVNGKLNSAEIYPSNGLFRKMWPKLLNASAAEAIAAGNNKTASAPPSIEDVKAFIVAADRASRTVTTLTDGVQLATRDAAQAVYFETSRIGGGWVHRSYLAK